MDPSTSYPHFLTSLSNRQVIYFMFVCVCVVYGHTCVGVHVFVLTDTGEGMGVLLSSSPAYSPETGPPTESADCCMLLG